HRARSYAFSDRPSGPRDVLFEDRSLPQPQHSHADHRRRICGGNCLAGTQSEICVRRSQNYGHRQTQQHRPPGELLHLDFVGNEGLVLGWGHWSLAFTLSLNIFPSIVLPASFACAAFITTPICLSDVAPVSENAASIAASISASLAPA